MDVQVSAVALPALWIFRGFRFLVSVLGRSFESRQVRTVPVKLIIIIIKILILYLSICTEIITINIEILHYYHIYQIFYVLKAVPVNQNKLI